MAQKIIKFTTGNKYIDLFMKHCRNTNDLEEVIKGISIVNATLLSTVASKEPDDIEDDIKKEIIRAYYHINAFIDTQKKQKKVLENWYGDYPLLFRMAWTFEDEEFDNTFNNLEDYKQDIVGKIVENIWKIRQYRKISVCYTDGARELEIPPTIKKKELEAYYEELKNTIALAFIVDGSIVVNYGEKNGARTVCGLRTETDGVCEIDAKTMKKCYCTAPDGSYLAPPDGYTFVDWQFC